MGIIARLHSWLPTGSTLPPEMWRRRHGWMLRVLWAHAIALFACGLILGHPLWHAALDAGPIFLCGAVGARTRYSRRGRSAAVCIGLLTASAVVVHLMNGAIEGHFHFFVMVSLLALYEEWFPYLLAFGYVLGHHGVMGLLEPSSVYNHPDAVAHPWRWAGIHALFIAGLGVVNVIHWRLNEQARAAAEHSNERFGTAFDRAPTGMALVGLDGVVQQANAALRARVGDDVVGRPLADLVLAADLGGRPFPAADGELELRYRDGRGWGLWHHSTLPGRDGAPEAWISHCIDVSGRRRPPPHRGRRAARPRAAPGRCHRPVRRRRVHDPPARRDESGRRRGGGRSRRRRPQPAARARRRAPLRLGERRAELQRPGGRRADAAARCRRGDVPRQGAGQGALRDLRRVDEARCARAPRARERAAPGARARRAAARLSAARHAGDGAGHRRRGAAALEPPGPWRRRAAALHPDRRAQRADHPDRRVGTRRGAASSPRGETRP